MRLLNPGRNSGANARVHNVFVSVCVFLFQKQKKPPSFSLSFAFKLFLNPFQAADVIIGSTQPLCGLLLPHN